ncbi:hypothetical protein [Cupriavidus taiwanensis]|uniref:Uncharacterized protein n=1 Tax=Cupriavidus taiwanensis (strain DSM 17343 / BCRC 17206 / CCUG 44338 / CIP 107171 / LMG 19424 / R1) TaxID=977880 RepID=B3R4H0_CUPTR|nr:hypothetical protein [Cupriavidus taiwanensis]CAQ69202.1 hypothetical protein; putative exported protein [Cupriavidus taiwanensis LMG 19424]
MKIRNYVSLAGAVSLAFALAACGGDNPTDAGPQPAAAGGQPSAPPAPGAAKPGPDRRVLTPPISAATRAILEADPASYAALESVAEPGYTLLGRIKPRTTAELRADGLTSHLMIGGETTDRNFSVFSNWREFLNPLGTTKVRIQSGWNDIEQTITTPATYSFAKLDEIIDGAIEQKHEPMVFLGYGNVRPGCTDCGGAGLGGSFPTGAGKERFLKFVEATVTRYKDKVTDWQIWNEPTKDLDTYKMLIVDTARLIKQIQPNAKLTIGSWYTVHYALSCLENCNDSAEVQDARNYILTSLKYFHDNKGPTVPSEDVYVAFHPYTMNVDYDQNPWDARSMENFLALVHGYGFKPRMDENGAPSTPCMTYAMCDSGTRAWTEKNQAKYNLRRVLGDLARGIETSMFTISDLHYNDAKNTKGLLTTGVWDPNLDTPFLNGDQRVAGKKIAYGAFQNVTALFDSRMEPVPEHGCTAPAGYTAHAWRQRKGGVEATVIGVWKKTKLPVPDTAEPRAVVQVSCNGIGFGGLAATGAAPRYVDMMDGRVYDMPAGTISANAPAAVTMSVPVADWPALVVDARVLQGSLR